MKKLFIILSASFIMASCSVFQPRIPYDLGMDEGKFLRQNKDAVLNNMDGKTKIYRVNRNDQFYILATFQDGELIKFEERELSPAWPQQREMDNRNR